MFLVLFLQKKEALYHNDSIPSKILVQQDYKGRQNLAR